MSYDAPRDSGSLQSAASDLSSRRLTEGVVMRFLEDAVEKSLLDAGAISPSEDETLKAKPLA